MNITVSIIEDDHSVRRILADWVNRAKGFQCVSEHASAESALAQLPKQQPDIVLVDINLPTLNGIQCVGRLKAAMPDTQFVMLTVYKDTEHIFNALAAGATGYLLKETDEDELIASLRQVHEGGAPMSSYIARKVVQLFHRSESEESGLAMLAPRELEVLELLARGHYYKEIADALGISMPTVNTHIHRIYLKLHVRSRGQATAKYAQFSPRRLMRSGDKSRTDG